MTTNELYNTYREGDSSVKERLFGILRESFSLFMQQKVRNEQDAEELVQEALVTIADRLDSVEIEVSFAAWCYRVLENKLLNYYRAKRYQQNRTAPAEEIDSAVSKEQLDPDLKRRLLECLRKVCEDNPRRARVLNLHYQGFSVDDVCRKLDLTRNSVYILLSRARQLLKHCLEKGSRIG